MSKLIQLRQRIRAIETIKKITHAMRLIAMSTHSQLKAVQDPITSYTNQLSTILNDLTLKTDAIDYPLLYPAKSPTNKTLVIIIGSQKGLCGSFNTHLFKAFQKTVIARAYSKQTIDLIPIGQKAIDYAQTLPHKKMVRHYAKFSTVNLSTIAQAITNLIITADEPYQSVVIVANEFKTFFSQIPKITDLIPFKPSSSSHALLPNDMIWEQTPKEIAAALIPQYLHAQIAYSLFESLYAEHAARFVSMDGATRNAKKLLDHAKLEYNKLRQAKITKELTELSGSYT